MFCLPGESFGRYLQFYEGILMSHIRFVRSMEKTTKLNDNTNVFDAYNKIYTEFIQPNGKNAQPINKQYIIEDIHNTIHSIESIDNTRATLHQMQSCIMNMLQQYFPSYMSSDIYRYSDILSVVLHSKRYDNILQCSKSIYSEEFVLYYYECDHWNCERTSHNIMYNDQQVRNTRNLHITDPSQPIEPPNDPYISHMLLEAKNLFTRFIRVKSEYTLDLPEYISENVVAGWNLSRRSHVLEKQLIDGLLHVQRRSLEKIKNDIWPVYVKETLINRQQKLQQKYDSKSLSSAMNETSVSNSDNNSRRITPPISPHRRSSTVSDSRSAIDHTTNSLANKPRIIQTPHHSLSITNNTVEATKPALLIETPSLTPIIVSTQPLSPASAETSPLQLIRTISKDVLAPSSRVPRRHSLDASDMSRISTMRQMITPASTTNNNSSINNNSNNTPSFQSIIPQVRSSVRDNQLSKPYQMKRNISNGLNSDLREFASPYGDESDNEDVLNSNTLQNNNISMPRLTRTLSDVPHMSQPESKSNKITHNKVSSTDQFEQYAYSVLSGQIAFQRNLCKLYAADDIDLIYFEKGGRFGSTHKQHNSHLVHHYVNTTDPFKIIASLHRRVVASPQLTPVQLSIDTSPTSAVQQQRQISADTPTNRISQQEYLSSDGDISDDDNDELLPYSESNKHKLRHTVQSQPHRRSVRFSFDTDFIPPDTTIDNVRMQSSDSVHSRQSTPKQSTKPQSIMKRPSVQLRSETITEVFDRVANERQSEAKIYLQQLIRGASLRKLNQYGKAERRYFWVSGDGSELCWSKTDSKGNKSSGLFTRKKIISLIDCVRIRYGATTAMRFLRYNNDLHESWLAFTVHMPDKSIDIVCENDRQVTEWYLGLQSLAPLSTSYLSIGSLLIKRARMKIRHLAKMNGLTPIDTFNIIIDNATYERRNKIAAEPIYSFKTITPLLHNARKAI